MGGNTGSSIQWQPPPEPVALTSSAPVDYHIVSSQVTLEHSTECGCCPTIQVTMDHDELYSMLAEQYSKGYCMLYFTRSPGDMHILNWSQVVRINFSAFFRINPNLGDRFDGSVSWQLHVDRTWLQSMIERTGGMLSFQQKREVDTSKLVDAITRNTQNGERLVAATVTGHAQTPSFSAMASGYGPNQAMDLFFEVPSPAPRERYMYNIALVPVQVQFVYKGYIFFPEIQCDWMSALSHHLNQGWRLVDIYIDIPIIEQLRTPSKRKRTLCGPVDTNALWIFERPASRAHDPTPLYEGTVVEQAVPISRSRQGLGVQSSPDWLPVIHDMGRRGWELSCILECHAVEKSGWSNATIKSLLFFQRPLA